MPQTVELKHKVPLAYSRADDGARSLNAIGMTDSKIGQLASLSGV